MDGLLKALWPEPQKVSVLCPERKFELPDECTFHVSVTLPTPNPSGTTFVDIFKLWKRLESAYNSLSCRIVFDVSAGQATESNGSVLLHEEQQQLHYAVLCCVNPIFFANQSQSYRIYIEKNIRICASDLPGLHYALQTLFCIVQYSKATCIPHISVEDSPSLLRRGVEVTSLMVELKSVVFHKILELLSLLRVNEIFYKLIHVPDGVLLSNPDLSAAIELQKLCANFFINVSPIYETNDDGGQLSMTGFKNFLLHTQRYFPTSNVIYLGPKLSKMLIQSSQYEVRSLMETFPARTFCLSNIESERVPFGCGLMSNKGGPHQIYRTVSIKNDSVAGCFTVFLNDAKDKMRDLTGSLGIILSDLMERHEFVTPFMFKFPTIIIVSGFLWNLRASQTCTRQFDIADKFLRDRFLRSGCDSLSSLIVELSQIEADIHPAVFHLLTDPDAVQLTSVESLCRASKQTRAIKQELMELYDSGDSGSRCQVDEAVFVCELMQFTLKLGRALCLAGRNPDRLGLSVVNLGINNLPATIKTDLANTLLGVIKKMKTALSHNYEDQVVIQNNLILCKMLERLYPEKSDFDNSEFQLHDLLPGQQSNDL